jgi:hypothetical protein
LLSTLRTTRNQLVRWIKVVFDFVYIHLTYIFILIIANQS